MDRYIALTQLDRSVDANRISQPIIDGRIRKEVVGSSRYPFASNRMWFRGGGGKI